MVKGVQCIRKEGLREVRELIAWFGCVWRRGGGV